MADWTHFRVLHGRESNQRKRKRCGDAGARRRRQRYNGVSKDTLEAHAARMWPFNGERTSSCAEHWKRLPEGFGVVQDILGHRLHARGAQVLVRYYMVPHPTWEFISGMREPNLGWNSIYKAYCETHGLPLEGGPQWHDAREDPKGSA